MGDITNRASYKSVKLYHILHADLSQANEIFGRDQNKQCTAICAIAIATAEVLDPILWEKNTMTQIILRGNQYYVVSDK